MEVLERGEPRLWSTDVECTGEGNDGFNKGTKGCGSKLRVGRDDLRHYEGTEYPIWRDAAVTMKCPVCGCLTDLDRDDWPVGASDLRKFSNAWARGENDGTEV